MKTIEEYAIDLVAGGAESFAEDDLNEDEEIADDHHEAACDLAIRIPHHIRNYPETVLNAVGHGKGRPVTWFRFVVGANIAVWAFVLFLAVFVAVRRLRPREPDPEPVHPSAPAARTGTVLLRMVRDLVHRRREAPVHIGATERWSPISSIRTVGVSPELVTETEQMVADHRALDCITAAVQDFDKALENVLDQLLADDPQLRMRLPAGVDDTGQYDLAELEELLRGEEVPV